MLTDILLLILGLALIVFGADYLVEGASFVAGRFGVSQFVIGLTIVGMGTSAPELVVSLTGAFKGSADIAIGNVVGSNIFNTLMILGVSAMILPLVITRANLRRDLPVQLGVTLLLLGLGFTGGGISRLEGAILLVLFALYMWMCFRFDDASSDEPASPKSRNLTLNIVMIVGGLAGLIFGGRFFVDSATSLAYRLGASEKFIAITLLAGGTSLPELATCVVAATKKKGSLALGNIIGSNIFNMLLILGSSAVVMPLSFSSINWVDSGVLVVSTLILFFAAWTRRDGKISRTDGAMMLMLWLGYMVWLGVNISN